MWPRMDFLDLQYLYYTRTACLTAVLISYALHATAILVLQHVVDAVNVKSTARLKTDIPEKRNQLQGLLDAARARN